MFAQRLSSDHLMSVVRLAAACCIPILVVLSLLPSGEMVRTGFPKVVEHFIAYGGTAGLAALGWITSWRERWAVLVGLILLAATLEYSQRWSAGREPGIDTFLASALGVCAGVAIGAVALAVLTRRMR